MYIVGVPVYYDPMGLLRPYGLSWPRLYLDWWDYFCETYLQPHGWWRRIYYGFPWSNIRCYFLYNEKRCERKGAHTKTCVVQFCRWMSPEHRAARDKSIEDMMNAPEHPEPIHVRSYNDRCFWEIKPGVQRAVPKSECTRIECSPSPEETHDIEAHPGRSGHSQA